MLSNEYIAGFFDADGSVGIYKRQSKSTTSYQVCVSIANSGHHGRIVCNHLVNRFGGTVTTQKAKSSTHRDSFWFKINGAKRVKAFLQEITPSLVIKRDQALKCLEFLAEWEKMPRYNKTPEQLKYMAEAEAEVKRLKVLS
jgi:intein-encoded DNA endonuclease-like protein